MPLLSSQSPPAQYLNSKQHKAEQTQLQHVLRRTQLSVAFKNKSHKNGKNSTKFHCKYNTGSCSTWVRASSSSCSPLEQQQMAWTFPCLRWIMAAQALVMHLFNLRLWRRILTYSSPNPQQTIKSWNSIIYTWPGNNQPQKQQEAKHNTHNAAPLFSSWAKSKAKQMRHVQPYERGAVHGSSFKTALMMAKCNLLYSLDFQATRPLIPPPDPRLCHH